MYQPKRNYIEHGIEGFKKNFPNAASCILSNLINEKEEKCQIFEPCVLEKAYGKAFDSVIQKPEEPLDALSTDTTGQINPPGIKGNIYLQLVVDAASGHTQEFLMKKKTKQ